MVLCYITYDGSTWANEVAILGTIIADGPAAVFWNNQVYQHDYHAKQSCDSTKLQQK